MTTLKRMLFALTALTCSVSSWGQTQVSSPIDTLSSEAVADYLAKNPKAHASNERDAEIVVKLYKELFYGIRESKNNDGTSASVFREIEEFMSMFREAHLYVAGYADRGTGNYQLNQMYAGRRAAQVRDDLIHHHGIAPNRITSESLGDVVQPHKNNDKNRCIIISGYGYLSTKENPMHNTCAYKKAHAQRKEFRTDRDVRYTEERSRQARLAAGRDTIVIAHVDTLWIGYIAERDSLKPERPLGLNKEHRWRNWFLTAGVGPAIFQGDHNSDAKYFDRIYPAFSLQMGKWIYPLIGIRAGVNLDVVHSFYNDFQDIHHSERYTKRPWLMSRMHYASWNFHADLMINLSSLIWRPYSKRIYSLIPYGGVGCIATWDQPWFDYATSWNVGVLNSFRVAESWDINLDIRLKKFADHFNGYGQGRTMEGMTNVSIGATWYFTKRGF